MPSSRGIFPTQGSNPGLPHCRQILYCLSYQGSPLHSICLKKHTKQTKKKLISRDFPGGPVIKNPPPSNAGDVGLIPGQGTKILHVLGQLHLHATARKSPHRNEDPEQSKTNKREKERKKEANSVTIL